MELIAPMLSPVLRNLASIRRRQSDFLSGRPGASLIPKISFLLAYQEYGHAEAESPAIEADSAFKSVVIIGEGPVSAGELPPRSRRKEARRFSSHNSSIVRLLSEEGYVIRFVMERVAGFCDALPAYLPLCQQKSSQLHDQARRP